MIDYDIEWLFEEVYNINKSGKKQPIFISDWDVDGAEIPSLQSIISETYNRAGILSSRYRYSYEQFDLKDQIANYIVESLRVELDSSCITISPSATSSINLVLESLAELKQNRILLFTPVYFSVNEVLDRLRFNVFYYHLKDSEDFRIDYTLLKKLLKEQFIESIFISDPVYSSGIKLTPDDYNSLVTIANELNINLIIDNSLGGLEWDKEDNFVIDGEKLKILLKCTNYILIDTLSKRLLLNGLKFSLILGSYRVIDKIDLISETLYGALSTAQYLFIKKLYDKEAERTITEICKVKIQKFRECFNLITSILRETQFQLAKTNSGYFSILSHRDVNLRKIDTKETALWLLKTENILAIPNDRFSYYPENKFGLRINLNNNPSDLLPAISKCIRVDYSRFYYRQ